MTTDSELLRQYAEKSDEAAFAEVVRRQVDFVYSAALRVVNGDVYLAQDVTQSVFVQLACHAGMLAERETVLGWLHTTARNTAIKAIRGEQRRHAREQEATLMNDPTMAAEINWSDLRPVLDEAVHKLGEGDRNAVLLRFFKGLSHQEVGAVLGVSEDTARKRVERALEKLRLYFARRGVTVSSALLATAIRANSVQAAPVDLAARVTGPSLAGVDAAGIGGILWRALYMSTKTKIIVATIIIIGIIAATVSIYLQRPGEPPSITPAVPAPSVASIPAPAPTPMVVPKLIIPARGETPTAVAVEPKPDATTADPATQPTEDPRLSLETAIPEAIRMLEAQDFDGFFKEFLSDSQKAELTNENMTIEQMIELARQDPKFQQGFDQMIKDLRTVQGQTPVLDASGNKATFPITKNPGEPGPTQVIFNKVDGLWYMEIH